MVVAKKYIPCFNVQYPRVADKYAMQLIAQIDEERKSKALIQVSLGLSIILHLLILGAVVSESTDTVDVGDDPRTQPLIVKLQEPTHTQTPSRSQTTNAKELPLQREGHPEPDHLLRQVRKSMPPRGKKMLLRDLLLSRLSHRRFGRQRLMNR